MFTRLSVLFLAILSLGVLPFSLAAADEGKGKIRVVLIDGQNNHDWRATTPIMKKALEDLRPVYRGRRDFAADSIASQTGQTQG